MKKLLSGFALVVAVGLAGCSDIKEWYEDEFGDKPAVNSTYAARVTSVTAAGSGTYINFNYTDISAWPLQYDKKKNRYARGWITVNGVSCEMFWDGMHKQHLNNVYGGPPYGVKGLKTGEKAKIGLRSTDGKFEAAPFDFVWPFKGT